MLSTPSSSSSQVLSPSLPMSPWQQEMFPIMSNTSPFTPTISVPDAVNPFVGQPSLPFQFSTQNHQAANIQQYLQAVPFPHGQAVGSIPLSLPRKYKDDAGKFQVPGLRDLPPHIQSDFRNTFIRHIMKLTFSGTSPWTGPTLPVYQQEFAAIYPDLPYEIHAHDAVVLPVSFSGYGTS